MQFLCECMKIDCEIDCNARGRQLRSCLGHQITQGRHCVRGVRHLTLYPPSPRGRVTDIGYLPLQLRWCFRGASRPARDSGWWGAAACLNRFRGFSESIQPRISIDIELGKNLLQCTDESIFFTHL